METDAAKLAALNQLAGGAGQNQREPGQVDDEPPTHARILLRIGADTTIITFGHNTKLSIGTSPDSKIRIPENTATEYSALNKGTDAWMDHRLAIGLGALLNVNIRVQSATDGRITDAYTAADGNTVTLNYYPNLHYDIQQHLPNHDPPVRRNNADSGDATSASPRAPTNRQDRAGPAERTEAQDDANTSDDNNRDDGEAKPM
jgi:hypothetical protein